MSPVRSLPTRWCLRPRALAAVLLAHALLLMAATHAEDRASVPPKNRDGFSLSRDALYDAAQGLGVEERPIGEPLPWIGDRFWDRDSAQYLLSDVENRGFRAGDDALEHLPRLEPTRSFC